MNIRWIFDWLGGVYFIHLITIVVLTPWLLFLVGMPWEAYKTWFWQALLIAPFFNAIIYHSTLWFSPKWRKLIGYVEKKPQSASDYTLRQLRLYCTGKETVNVMELMRRGL